MKGWKFFFYAGKSSDVLYVPPWRIAASESKGEHRWIVLLPTEYQADIGHSQPGY